MYQLLDMIIFKGLQMLQSYFLGKHAYLKSPLIFIVFLLTVHKVKMHYPSNVLAEGPLHILWKFLGHLTIITYMGVDHYQHNIYLYDLEENNEKIKTEVSHLITQIT